MPKKFKSQNEENELLKAKTFSFFFVYSTFECTLTIDYIMHRCF